MGHGDSETGFKSSLIRYLNTYQVSALKPYINAINMTNFSSVNSIFIGSAPGSHQGSSLCHFGHMAVASYLRKHLKPCTWPLVMQCSSIGSLGNTPLDWMVNELGTSLGPKNKEVKVIYPSKKNVFRSIDGIIGGGCLPYRKNTHQKQPWLQDYLHQWTSDRWQRTKVPPHIKTYSQVNDNQAAFLLLTSANLSRAAWGKLNKNQDRLNIMSWEAGVLLLPKFVHNDITKDFDIKQSDNLILPYDWPLTEYGDDDSPFFYDYLEDHLQTFR